MKFERCAPKAIVCRVLSVSDEGKCTCARCVRAEWKWIMLICAVSSAALVEEALTLSLSALPVEVTSTKRKPGAGIIARGSDGAHACE